MEAELINKKFSACTLDDFVKIKELHRSHTGCVSLVKFKYDDKKQYIIKERKSPELGGSKDIMHEANLLAKLNHENIVKCEG